MTLKLIHGISQRRNESEYYQEISGISDHWIWTPPPRKTVDFGTDFSLNFCFSFFFFLFFFFFFFLLFFFCAPVPLCTLGAKPPNPQPQTLNSQNPKPQDNDHFWPAPLLARTTFGPPMLAQTVANHLWPRKPSPVGVLCVVCVVCCVVVVCCCCVLNPKRPKDPNPKTPKPWNPKPET